MNEWFKEEDFWESCYPFLFPPERLENGTFEVESILTLTGISKGEALDLCCGPGRHAIALAQSGFQVTAVDITPFLLEKGVELGRSKGLEIEWVREDMKSFKQKNRYHLVINLFTSFGFFENEEENRTVLSNIYDSLREGGVAVFEMMGKEVLAQHYQETQSKRLSDGSLFIQRNEIIDSWRRVKNQWILIKDGTTREYHFHLWLYSATEMAWMLEEIGFSEVEIFGDLEGAPYDVKAKRLIVMAKKG